MPDIRICSVNEAQINGVPLYLTITTLSLSSYRIELPRGIALIRDSAVWSFVNCSILERSHRSHRWLLAIGNGRFTIDMKNDAESEIVIAEQDNKAG